MQAVFEPVEAIADRNSELVADRVGVAQALGKESAVVVGHDLGAPVATDVDMDPAGYLPPRGGPPACRSAHGDWDACPAIRLARSALPRRNGGWPDNEALL